MGASRLGRWVARVGVVAALGVGLFAGVTPRAAAEYEWTLPAVGQSILR
jgi:hypothetical protein